MTIQDGVLSPQTPAYEDPESNSKIVNGRLILVSLLWAAVILARDFTVPSEVAVAVPYIGLVLMGLWLPHRHYIPIAALGATLLTILGFLNQPVVGDLLTCLFHRFMAVMAIWVTAILCYGFKRDESVLKVTRESLERQVKELRELKEKFEWIAQTDPLTELPNRRGMSEKLEFEKLRYKRSEKPFGIILADMDSLKRINDRMGHDAGDKILIQIAKIFKFCCRRTDLVSRWGGDEFMVLLPDTDLQGTHTIAEKIRNKIASQPFQYGSERITVGMSFGVCVYDQVGMDLSTLIKRADDCLYKAKDQGKGKVVSHTSTPKPDLASPMQ